MSEKTSAIRSIITPGSRLFARSAGLASDRMAKGRRGYIDVDGLMAVSCPACAEREFDL